MIDFELNIIDWNAISAIATTLAFVIAFVVFLSLIKMRKEHVNFRLIF